MAISFQLSKENRTIGWSNEGGFTVYTKNLAENDLTLLQAHGIVLGYVIVPLLKMQYVKRDYLGTQVQRMN